MKRKFLKITGIMVLLLALGGFWGYNHYLKPNPVIQQQLNTQFGADFFNSFTDDDVLNNSAAVAAVNNAELVDDLTEKTNTLMIISRLKKVNEQDKGTIVTNLTADKESIVKRMTQGEVINMYRPKFNYLHNVAMSRLDTLYSAATQEYVQNSKAGTVSRSELARKYIQAGTMLEANLDSQFYSTLNTMQAELIANDLSTDIVGVYKSEYEKAKSDKRSQLLAKVAI